MSYLNGTFQQGYYFVGGLAYTEDDIKIHKLYVYGIPIQLKEDQLLPYFEGFGRVESLKFLNNEKMEHQVEWDSGDEKFQTACVFFTNPRNAATVLLNERHKIKEHRFYLTASYSWHQPEAYDSTDKLTVCLEQSYILQIPDDCLYPIFKFLNLGNQLRFSRVCKRFRDVYQKVSRSIYKSVEFTELDDLTIWYMRDFYLLSGQDIENLSILNYDFDCRICSFIGANCVNLKSLIFVVTILSKRNLIQMLANTNKLEILSLEMCQLTDDSLVALKKLKNLKKLILADNLNLTGDTFMELPNSIEELDVSECCNLKSSNLILLFETLPNLKDLNHIGILDTKNLYETLVLKCNCLKLETLRIEISKDSNYEEIVKLPNLKFIRIACLCKNIRAQFFDQLVLLKSKQLEQLEIKDARVMTDQMFMQIAKLSGLKKLSLYNVPVNDNILQFFTKLNNMEQISLLYCNDITDKGVLRLLLGCPKLKVLRLMTSRLITENLVNDIIKKMDGLGNERKLPIHLYIEEDQISNAIKRNVPENIIKIFDIDP